MAKSLAILQSSYIPWKGHFDLIHKVEEFLFLEDVQFTIRDWRTRNSIKTPNGPLLLTIPVHSKGYRDKKICEIELNHETRWAEKHWASLRHNYSKAPFFKTYSTVLEDMYLGRSWTLLSEFNIAMMTQICSWLGIATNLLNTKDIPVSGAKSEKILNLCLARNATHYVSGAAAKDYLDLDAFARHGITVEFMTYVYPPYPQLHGEFIHNVSILDLLFNTGPDAPRYIWGDIAEAYRAAQAAS